MAPPLLTLQDIHLTFGGTPLLEGAALSIAPGERLCLVGRNGSGKSTLLKIAAGLIEADRGERFLQPGSTIRYLPQELAISGYETVLAYVEEGLEAGDDPYRAAYLLGQLGLTGDEHPEHLSGGEVRRAALARVLAPAPDILLLDEPTNHLDLPTIEWLEAELAAMGSALVQISHDRRFLEGLAVATVWLDRGVTRRLDQGFAKFEEWRDEILDQEELDRHKLDRKIVREEHWLRYGVTARRKRNQGRLRALNDLRQARRDQRPVTGRAKLVASDGVVAGKLIVEAEGLSKSYDGRAIVADLDLRIERGSRIGIVGANGAGKTTLLNLLAGVMAPDAGIIRLGVGLQMVTLDQRRESLDPEWTLIEALTGGTGDTVVVQGQSRHVVSYMKDFLFTPEQVRTPISTLSGGERGRLMLARALARPSNLLVLDEPTNDLDLETLDLLQEMLANYAGTLLLVSHDRDFLDRVVTSVVAAEGHGRWLEYAGGYCDMMAQRGPGVAKRAATVRLAKAKTAPVVPAKMAKRRLSFNDKHALKTLPNRIAGLEADIARLHETLDDAGLYARDPSAFAAKTAELAAADADLAAAEEQWLALEVLKEEVE
ncbi:MAG: ABC-F family ATP-binding cassette domain-containing protein, partial [Alphaproteobacteria bacterium]